MVVDVVDLCVLINVNIIWLYRYVVFVTSHSVESGAEDIDNGKKVLGKFAFGC